MDTDKAACTTIDEYIAQFPPEVEEVMQTLRKAIKETVPEAQEKISWQMPTFYLHGNLVHFAAHKNHIGFYPGAEGISAFQEDIAGYKSSKGAVQFPLKEPLPLDLIRRIVQYRAAQNIGWAQEKKKKK